MFGIQDLTKIRCRTWANAKKLYTKWDLTATWEMGFTNIWARNVGFFTMKKMGDVTRDFREKGAGMQEFQPRQPPRQKGYNCNIITYNCCCRI